MLKPLTLCITTNCRKFIKRREYQTTWHVSWENCMWFKKQQLETNMETMDWFKTRKGVRKDVYCHSVDITYMQSSVQFSRSEVSDSLQPHESQHARPPCPSQISGVHSNSSPSSWWCHPAISSSVVPFSSYTQSLPVSESFPMSQLFSWGGQSTGVSA